jgi:hypothetical protein
MKLVFIGQDVGALVAAAGERAAPEWAEAFGLVRSRVLGRLWRQDVWCTSLFGRRWRPRARRGEAPPEWLCVEVGGPN